MLDVKVGSYFEIFKVDSEFLEAVTARVDRGYQGG
jgi:hypothetical protein